MSNNQKKVEKKDYAFVTIIILGLIAFYFFGLIIQNVYGATFVGIIPSESCKRSLTCPSIKELVTIYDNTNQGISGKFGNDTHGNYLRLAPPLKNHWMYYQYSNQFLMAVDPDAQWTKHLNYQITIVPSHFVYFDRDNKKMTNQTLTQFHDRKIREGCTDAIVYYEYLADTLNYLLTHCQITEFKEQVDIYYPLIPINYADHKWYNYTAWLKQAKENCKARC